MERAVVVGGGITGLVLAYRLHRQQFPVAVLEAGTRAGGVIQTLRLEDCLVECGPNSSLSKPELTALLDELGLSDALVEPPAEVKHRYIAQQDGSLAPVPRGPLEMAGWRGLSAAGKLRALAEPLLSRRSPREDDSVFDFISRHFGRMTAARVVAPMLGGIWAADISKLSCRSALPALWRLEHQHRSVVAGAARRYLGRTSGHNKSRPHIVSLRGGMERLVDALIAALPPDTVQYSCRVEQLERRNSGCLLRVSRSGRTEQLEAQHAYLCLPADETARLIKPLAHPLADAAAAIPYAPLGILHLRCPKAAVSHPLDGYGFLVPPVYGFALLGVLFSSSLFPGRAPEGDCLLTCFCGGAVRPEAAAVSNPGVASRAVDEVRRLLGIQGDVRLINTAELPRAIPNYPLGHWRTQQAVEEFNAAEPGISLLGNWHKGISMNCRIAQASECAERAALGRVDI